MPKKIKLTAEQILDVLVMIKENPEINTYELARRLKVPRNRISNAEADGHFKVKRQKHGSHHNWMKSAPLGRLGK
ncbi:MAG: hypothetical protein COW02_05055 [Comamonadaceae bacterium CG12_big_fil_rev_8_21_14_0_65_59_15]|nr:MAG: hypothetical protein COW02_05055 [Comamonadaceae bacterium CG12_big_fil_rev_8_21_14_0_65_59_15]